MVTPFPQPTHAAFVDSSALISLVDRDDYTHRAAVDAYESLKADGYRLFTSNHIVAETFDILAGALGHDVARSWLDEMGLPIYVADSSDHRAPPADGRRRASDATTDAPSPARR